jgi:hypothetical protein
MRQTIEFRVPEELAERYLPAEAGRRLGMGIARELRLEFSDPLVSEVRRIDDQLRERGEGAFFTSWAIRREYSRRELDEAELFHVWPTRVFEPAGEECGTVYDETAACDHVFEPESELDLAGRRLSVAASTCGAGSRQVTPLYLDVRRIPRKVDFAQTIAGEIVASAHARDVFLEKGLVGAELDPVRNTNADGAPSSEYFQLRVIGPRVELTAATRAGSNPFDETAHGRCPRGHVVGLSLLSEVHVQRGSLTNSDVVVTEQMIGVRRGLLRPQRVLLLSPTARRAIEDGKLRGLTIEVARVS